MFSALGDIKSEITRLGALLHEFRYLARPQRLEQKPVRLDSLISSVLMPNAYNQRGVMLEIDVPDDLPAISGDEERLKQVVENLADNAVDAMPEGGTLTVRAYRDGDELCLELADTGIGISPGVNIFELFTTTNPTDWARPRRGAPNRICSRWPGRLSHRARKRHDLYRETAAQ